MKRFVICLVELIFALTTPVLSLCPSNNSVIDFSNRGLTYINISLFEDCPPDAHILNLSGNRLTRIYNDSFLDQNHFVKFYNLKHLDLSNNSIFHIDVIAFQLLRNLESLNLSHNALTVLQNDLLFNKYSLRMVDFSFNNITDIETNVFNELHNSLRYVNVSHNSLQYIEPWAYRPPYLLHFDLFHNQIFTFTNKMNWQYNLREPYHASVDLRDNQLVYWNDSFIKQYNLDSDVETATDFVTYAMDVRDNPWFCDCNLYQFSRQFQNSFYKHADNSLLEVRCNGPPELHGKRILNDVGLDEFICNVTNNCPSGCLCQDRPEEKVLKVNCTNANLVAMPDILPYNPYNRTELYLADNKITAFDAKSYTPHITKVTLRNNSLEKIDGEAVRSMTELKYFNIENNRLRELPKNLKFTRFEYLDLKHNPFVCKCSMTWMREWIKLSPDDDDERDVKCTYDEKETFQIIDVTDSLLNCHYQVEIGLAIGFGVLLTIVIIIVIWAKKCPYETKVLVYRFFRCHPQDKYKIDEQETTEHDLYVSFDDTDIHIRQWVLRKLAKRLEEEKPRYSVFVPIRDILGGTDKADEIVTNIEKSKRIIIILSEKYDDNDWCRFECQRAEILEHNDGRVIFIKYHPEADEMIETEPWRSRVRGRKIFSPGEKRSERRWFWYKLKYELPVR